MTDHLGKRPLAIIAVVSLVLLAGCLTVTVEFTVHEDGTIDLEQEMTFGPELAEMLKETPDWDGPEAYAAMLAGDIDGPWQNVQSEGAELDDGSIWVKVTSTGNDPADIPPITVTIGDDQITFILKEDPMFDDEFGDEFVEQADKNSPPMQLSDDNDDFFDFPVDEIDVRYIVNMPGEIIDTNGEIRDDGRSVEWTLPFLMEHEIDQMEVTSELGEDDGASGIPGFTIMLAVFALLGGAYLVYRHRR